jgi:hypothetical protein
MPAELAVILTRFAEEQLARIESDRKFSFVSQLAQVGRGGFYAVDVPAKISQTIGKRGPVPVTARINNVAEFTASLSPAGGGRHRLRINARTREESRIHVGDSVKVQIVVLSQPQKVVIPNDLKTALRSEGMLEFFETFAPGKQNHIIGWIEESARRETREKRIQFTVEITHTRREKRKAREKPS